MHHCRDVVGFTGPALVAAHPVVSAIPPTSALLQQIRHSASAYAMGSTGHQGNIAIIKHRPDSFRNMNGMQWQGKQLTGSVAGEYVGTAGEKV